MGDLLVGDLLYFGNSSNTSTSVTQVTAWQARELLNPSQPTQRSLFPSSLLSNLEWLDQRINEIRCKI